jgi:hypothetical protein
MIEGNAGGMQAEARGCGHCGLMRVELIAKDRVTDF